MGTIHEFFYDNKWLGILVFLVGASYAGVIYFRAWGQWSTERRKGRDTRLRDHLQKQTERSGSGTGRVIKPSTGEGQQEDLLARLAREEDTDEPADHPATVPTGRGTRGDLRPDPAHRSTHILKPARSDTESDDDTAGEERTPLQNAIRAAVEESLREDERDQSADFEAAEATPASAQEALTSRLSSAGDEETAAADDDEAAEDAGTATTEPPSERKRRISSPEEAQRWASRHEELGFHREVHADQIADPGIRRYSDADRKARLSQLGIAFDADTVETDAQRRARLGTDELDDILGRLDAALADTGTAPRTTTSAPPVQPAGDAHAPTLPMDEAPPAEAASSETSVDGRAPTLPMDEATSSDAPVDGRAPTLPMDGIPAERPVAETAPDPHAPTLPLGEAPSDPLPGEGAGDDSDEDLVLERGTTTDPGAEPTGEDPAEDEDEDDVRADTDDDAIPDWARADTFDDDESSGGEAEQQKLF